MSEIVYLEDRHTPGAVFHAVGEPSYRKPRITECGIPVSLTMPEARRGLQSNTRSRALAATPAPGATFSPGRPPTLRGECRARPQAPAATMVVPGERAARRAYEA